jgi:hypothetical protein
MRPLLEGMVAFSHAKALVAFSHTLKILCDGSFLAPRRFPTHRPTSPLRCQVGYRAYLDSQIRCCFATIGLREAAIRRPSTSTCHSCSEEEAAGVQGAAQAPCKTYAMHALRGGTATGAPAPDSDGGTPSANSIMAACGHTFRTKMQPPPIALLWRSL